MGLEVITPLRELNLYTEEQLQQEVYGDRRAHRDGDGTQGRGGEQAAQPVDAGKVGPQGRDHHRDDQREDRHGKHAQPVGRALGEGVSGKGIAAGAVPLDPGEILAAALKGPLGAGKAHSAHHQAQRRRSQHGQILQVIA